MRQSKRLVGLSAIALFVALVPWNGELRQGMDRVDPDMENRGLSYLKILEYIHHNEK